MAKSEPKPKTERKNLPDVLDCLEDSKDDMQRAIRCLERAHQIKLILGSERDKRTGKPEYGDKNYGLLAELEDLKDELKMIQVANDLEGLRHGRLGSASIEMDGRQYLDPKLLMEAGVTAAQIVKGTKQGDSYYQTTLWEIKSA
jgi:hypothetical protein